jgi:hypothetical protein
MDGRMGSEWMDGRRGREWMGEGAGIEKSVSYHYLSFSDSLVKNHLYSLYF